LSKLGLLRLLRVIAGPLLDNLSSRGDCPNLLARLKGVNNKGIDKRDVCFDVFDAFDGFDILKF
jgi:hypothetical protein